MEVRLFHMRDFSPADGAKIEIAACDTEQGIQFRLIHTHRHRALRHRFRRSPANER